MPEICTPYYCVYHTIISFQIVKGMPFFIKQGQGNSEIGGGNEDQYLSLQIQMLSQREKFRKEFIWMLRVWKLFSLKLSPRAYDMENFVYPRIPCFGNTVWMIQYSNDFLNFGWSFHELSMWPMVLLIDKSIGMGFLKMEWTDEKCNLKSKWREFDTQWEKGF